LNKNNNKSFQSNNSSRALNSRRESKSTSATRFNPKPYTFKPY